MGEQGLAARIAGKAAILYAERVELGELLAEHAARFQTDARGFCDQYQLV